MEPARIPPATPPFSEAIQIMEPGQAPVAI
jgi:hypothetical protein